MTVSPTGIARNITFTPKAGGANVCEVKLQVVDAYGDAVAEAFNFIVWLSDAATGIGLTGTDASGTVKAKSACGTDFKVLTAKKAILVQTLADGSYTLEITASTKTAFYVAATIPGGPNAGRTTVSTVLATANYG